MEPLLFETMRGRRSVRHYQPDVAIPREELLALVSEATRAPSGGNLQSWRFLILDDPELKTKLQPIAYNQAQISQSSAVIIVLGDLEGWRKAGEIYRRSAEAGMMTAEIAEQFEQKYVGLYQNMPAEDIRQTVTVDASLAAMQLMLAARARGWDTVPMRGYDKTKLVEAFNLPEHYLPVMVIAIGQAAQEGRPSLRVDATEVTFFNSLD